jgi:small subunit ribosomal protein S17
MPNKRRRLIGHVMHTKMEKTVAVRVDRSYRHRVYGKVLRSSEKYLVHDEMGCQPGDRVMIVESRPLSMHKRWVVQSILRKAEEPEVAAAIVEIEEVEMLERQAEEEESAPQEDATPVEEAEE